MLTVLPKKPVAPIPTDPRVAELISAAHSAYIMLEALDHTNALLPQRRHLAESLTDLGVPIRKPLYLVLTEEERKAFLEAYHITPFEPPAN